MAVEMLFGFQKKYESPLSYLYLLSSKLLHTYVAIYKCLFNPKWIPLHFLINVNIRNMMFLLLTAVQLGGLALS